MQTDWWRSRRGEEHRDPEKGSWLGKGTRSKSQAVKKNGLVGWLVGYFIQPTGIFLSVSYMSDTGPGTEATYTDKS